MLLELLYIHKSTANLVGEPFAKAHISFQLFQLLEALLYSACEIQLVLQIEPIPKGMKRTFIFQFPHSRFPAAIFCMLNAVGPPNLWLTFYEYTIAPITLESL